MKHNRLRRANWLLASSVASYGLVNPALARFDSSTFSILALLVNKSKNRYSKFCKIMKNFKKLPDFEIKMFKDVFCPWSHVM